jgi:RluA family pseudouridine synthase
MPIDNNTIMVSQIVYNNFQIGIVLEDEDLLAVNKPAGVLSIPGGFSPDTPDLKSILEPDFGPLWTVHRLDKDTSGLVLMARNSQSHRCLNLQFDDRSISKEYRAIVYGVPQWKELQVDTPLLVNGDRNHRTIVSKQGKPASTLFQVLHRFPCFAYLAAFPHTGLTHQIRAHLASITNPILMDEVYGKSNILPDDTNLIQRTALHALQIQFRHPRTNNLLVLKAPLPDDFRQALEKIAEVTRHDEQDYNAIYNTVAYQISQKKNRKNQ